jgi:hypothetical protein
MIILLASGIVLAASSSGAAQRWGYEPVPRDGACFYKDKDYGGQYFCVPAGGDVASMPGGMNDSISSIRVFGRTEVRVFRDIRYEGNSSRFDYDVRDLRNEGWNDKISSIRVRGAGYGGYQHDNGYRGDGQAYQNADVIVTRAYRDVLERDPDPAGMRLYRSHIIEDGWNEARVRDTLRNSPEYREKNAMSTAKAQDIVRRAYLSVLKREPDAASGGYVNDVLRKHYTQQDVERELRNSAEYRNSHR